MLLILSRRDIAWVEDIYRTIARSVGTVGVYLQARLIDKDKFLALQKRILSEYRFKLLSEDDFIKLLTEAGSSNAAEFFKIEV